MTKFETLFGIREPEIKDTCIIMPLLFKNAMAAFGVKNMSRGKIYSSGNAKRFTLINTGIGASFAGDAVLYLTKTNCKRLILFGSCGLVQSSGNLGLGSLVTPLECFAMESFTDLLLEDHDFKTFYPDKLSISAFLHDNKNIQKVNCATLGSLKLEEENLGLFKEKNIQVVDMECSGFFSAASHNGLKAMALFYISDIIKEKPFYENFDRKDKEKLFSSIESGIKSLCSFIR